MMRDDATERLMDDSEFRNISISELARISGFHKSRWSRYLSGKVAMSTSTLDAFAASISMPSDRFLCCLKERIEKKKLDLRDNAS
jgi:transcriptional regulator with XRE-family HTH domain